MENKKVYVVGGDIYYTSFLKNFEITENIEDADVVLFTGGEDVSPSIYKCKKHRRTFCNIKRDKAEEKIFNKIRPDQLAVGICRGSQFLCVMNGGILIQDCDNHAIGHSHPITNGKMEFDISSTHHQMQYPFVLDDKDYTILYKAINRCSRYEGDKIDIEALIENGEPEVVLYHKEGKPLCLAIQGHPEFMPDSPVSNMLNDLINKYHVSK